MEWSCLLNNNCGKLVVQSWGSLNFFRGYCPRKILNSSICRVNRIRKFNGWLDCVSVSILTVRGSRFHLVGNVELSGKSEFVTRNIDHVINLQTIKIYGNKAMKIYATLLYDATEKLWRCTTQRWSKTF